MNQLHKDSNDEIMITESETGSEKKKKKTPGTQRLAGVDLT